MISCRALTRYAGVSRSKCDQRIECKATTHRTLPSPSKSSRRALISGFIAGGALALFPEPQFAVAESLPTTDAVSVLSQEEGTGTVAAQQGDLVLVHYVGRLSDGTVFDSTRGGLVRQPKPLFLHPTICSTPSLLFFANSMGPIFNFILQKYRDGGDGVFRPAIIKLGADPVPGIVAGLTAAIVGMKVGSKVTVNVPPSLGFGSTTQVLAPYAIVPPGSELKYDIELVRLSRRGPDALLQGVAQCGGGFVNERTKGCADITPAEFL